MANNKVAPSPGAETSPLDKSTFAVDPDPDKECGYKYQVSLSGSLISKLQFAKPFIARDFTYCDTVRTGFKLYWLGVNDDRASCRDDILTEQTNIGLLSALILTVTFPYMLAVADLDWDYIALQWGNSTDSTVNYLIRNADAASGEDIARVHRDMLTILSLVASVGYLLSTIHSVLTIMMVSNLNGAAEAQSFSERLGTTNTAGMYFFLLGSMFTVGMLAYHFFIFASFVASMVIGIGIVLAIVLIFAFGVTNRQVLAVYQIKKKAYCSPPITLPIPHLEDKVIDFCKAVGTQHLRADVLAEFIRDREAAARSKEGAVVAPYEISFSAATEKVIETLAEKVLDSYVAKVIASGRKENQLKEEPKEEKEIVVVKESRLDELVTKLIKDTDGTHAGS